MLQEGAQLDRLASASMRLTRSGHAPGAADRGCDTALRSRTSALASTADHAASTVGFGAERAQRRARRSRRRTAMSPSGLLARSRGRGASARPRPPAGTACLRPASAAGRRCRAACRGARRRFGHPVGDDVVVGLVGRRDLHQLDAAGAPVADRLDPGARPPLVARLEVLVVREARGRAASGRSRAGSSIANDVTSRRARIDAAGARSIRRSPVWIDRPSESCTSGR